MDYTQCGLACFNCPWYLASKDEEVRKSIAESAGISVEKVVCNGCRNENGICAAFGGEKQCETYKCVLEKKVTFCFECSEFPCLHLHPYADKASVLPHNTKVYNLCLIKQLGVDRWAKDKSEEVFNRYFNDKWKV